MMVREGRWMAVVEDVHHFMGWVATRKVVPWFILARCDVPLGRRPEAWRISSAAWDQWNSTVQLVS